MDNKVACSTEFCGYAEFLLHEYGFAFFRVMSAPFLPCKIVFSHVGVDDEEKNTDFCDEYCFLLPKENFIKLYQRLYDLSLTEDLLSSYLGFCSENTEYVFSVKNPDGESVTIDYTEPLSARQCYKLYNALSLGKNENKCASRNKNSLLNLRLIQSRMRFWLTAYIYCHFGKTDNFMELLETNTLVPNDVRLIDWLDFFNKHFYEKKPGDCTPLYYKDIVFPSDSSTPEKDASTSSSNSSKSIFSMIVEVDDEKRNYTG